MEIERKFLKTDTTDITEYPFKEVTQGYLSFDPEIRIRSLNNEEFYLTQKSNGTLAREETEVRIDNTTYQILTSLIQGRIISKTRYYVPLEDNLTAEVDVYHEDLEGLVTIETEFTSTEQAQNFRVPKWYGKEITSDKRYKNKNLAKCNEDTLKELIPINNKIKIKRENI